MKKILALLLAVVMVIGLMAACDKTGDNTKPTETQGATQGGSADTQATDPATEPTREYEERYGGHLNVAITASIVNVDPYKNTNVWKYMWTTCVFENVLSRDANNNIQPGVCNFEISEDKLTVKLWVREGKTFHDGSPVEIEDVKASLERSCGGLFKSGVTYVANLLESSTIEGDVLTLKFHTYNEKTLYYLAAYQTWLSVIPKEICEKYGQEIITDMADAIGTGPYKIIEWQDSVYLTVEKYEGYVTQEEDKGKTGAAAAKYGYMDTISFHTYAELASAVIATLAGQYDVVEDMEDEMKPIAEANNVIETTFDSNTAMSILFNCKGTNNVCAKYPSLRKAVCAAIDFNEYAYVRHGEGNFINGGNFVLGDTYATDIFDNADYFGPTNLDAVAKYLEEAKKEGWDGVEPVFQSWSSSAGEYDTVLIRQYMERAGIPYEQQILESGANSEYLSDLNNNWCFKISFPGMTYTPTATTNDFMATLYNGPERDAILAEMNKAVLGSDEYMKLWEDLANQMVDDCQAVNMGFLVWSWHHNGELNVNDSGTQRYFFNSYWNDPENHPKKG